MAKVLVAEKRGICIESGKQSSFPGPLSRKMRDKVENIS